MSEMLGVGVVALTARRIVAPSRCVLRTSSTGLPSLFHFSLKARLMMASGKSLSLSQNTFLQPPGSRSVGIGEETPSTPTRRRKRNANVYDAVAGLSLHFSCL